MEYSQLFQKILHFPSQKNDSLRKVGFGNFSISKYNIICAEAAKVLQ